MFEQYVVVSSPIWNGNLIDSGYLSEPMSWDDAVSLLDRSIVEAAIVHHNDSIPLYWVQKAWYA